MIGLSAAQVWNVAWLVLSLIGMLVLICVWYAVSHPKPGRDRMYGVLGWMDWPSWWPGPLLKS